MDIDLGKADFVVLSHGHLDHTWGLEPLVDHLGLEKTRDTALIAHPRVFDRKIFRGHGDIGSRRRAKEMGKRFDLKLSSEPVWISDSLCFLGQIPRENDFEAQSPLGSVFCGDNEGPDFLLDDSGLAYRGPEGLVIIAGCSHAGICNTIRHAKQVSDETRIADIVGGFHLLAAAPGVLEKTGQYLRSCAPAVTHPSHCTDLPAKIELSRYVTVEEVGSGMVLEYA